MTDNDIRGYEAIKEIAREAREKVEDMLALAPKNDPFYAGAPAGRVKAEAC
ncbi:MAG: hypothetical protein ACUVX1_14425 [Chloroflexota bacterium]